MAITPVKNTNTKRSQNSRHVLNICVHPMHALTRETRKASVIKYLL